MTSASTTTAATGNPAGAAFSFDIATETEALMGSPLWKLRGHSTKTLVNEPGFRLVLGALRSGGRIQQHNAEHRIGIQTLTGHLTLSLAARSFDIPAGSVLVLDQASKHDLAAREDSTFLLSMSATVEEPSRGEVIDELDELLAEHRRFSKVFAVLDDQLAQFHRGDEPEFELLRDIFFYMTNYPDRFHHPREDLVFAKLAERDPVAREHVEELQRQHQLIAEKGALFYANLEAALSGTVLLRQAVEDPALEYLALYRKHMAVEEQDLFPRARQHLRQEDWAEVHAALGSEDDPIFGGLLEDRYRAIHEQIARASASD